MTEDNLYYPIILYAWAIPIKPIDTMEAVQAIVFEEDFPPLPNTDSVYTFMNENGVILKAPSYTDQYLPPFCAVRYVGEIPPPPFGYRYISSELCRNVNSPMYQLYHEVGTFRIGIDRPDGLRSSPFALTTHQRSGMESNLLELPEGYLSQDHGALISNFTVGMVRLIHDHGLEEEITSNKLEYCVCANGGYVTQVEQIDVELLETLPAVIRNKVPGCITNINVPKVDNLIAFHVRSSLLKIPTVERYTVSGWHRINGLMTYAHDFAREERVIFDTNFRIAVNPEMSPCSAMQCAMSILEISQEKEVIVPLVLFAHLGVLFTLFEQAGFPPRMLMFVNGKTGSLKTSVCSLLFNLTGVQKDNIPATFRDTIASIEAKFVQYTDKVLLLDDFSPPATAKAKASMSTLLEALIRYYGDGKGRGRSNISVTKANTPIPRGLCCITGEDTGGSQSSLLRCVLINVNNKTFNGELLAPFQQEPSRWTTHFNYFVQYVASNFDQLKEEIGNSVPVLRQQFGRQLNAGRTIDSAVYLCLVSKILLSYGTIIGWIDASDAASTIEYWSSLVVETLSKSEEVSTSLDPVRFLLETLFETVDSGEEVIAEDKEIFLKDSTVLGYDQSGRWHIWPDKLYGLVVKRCQLQRKYYPLSGTKMHAALAEEHLIEVSEENRNGKTQMNYLRRESFGGRPRMLVLNKEAAQKYLDEY